MPIKPIDLEFFNKTGKNVHECIVAASKRARQINDEMKIEFNQRVEMFTTRRRRKGKRTTSTPTS